MVLVDLGSVSWISSVATWWNGPRRWVLALTLCGGTPEKTPSSTQPNDNQCLRSVRLGHWPCRLILCQYFESLRTISSLVPCSDSITACLPSMSTINIFSTSPFPATHSYKFVLWSGEIISLYSCHRCENEFWNWIPYRPYCNDSLPSAETIPFCYSLWFQIIQVPAFERIVRSSLKLGTGKPLWASWGPTDLSQLDVFAVDQWIKGDHLFRHLWLSTTPEIFSSHLR